MTQPSIKPITTVPEASSSRMARVRLSVYESMGPSVILYLLNEGNDGILRKLTTVMGLLSITSG